MNEEVNQSNCKIGHDKQNRRSSSNGNKQQRALPPSALVKNIILLFSLINPDSLSIKLIKYYNYI